MKECRGVTSPSDQPTHQELADDLKAAVAARHELGKDMEEPVLESFLARVEEHIINALYFRFRRG